MSRKRPFVDRFREICREVAERQQCEVTDEQGEVIAAPPLKRNQPTPHQASIDANNPFRAGPAPDLSIYDRPL